MQRLGEVGKKDRGGITGCTKGEKEMEVKYIEREGTTGCTQVES